MMHRISFIKLSAFFVIITAISACSTTSENQTKKPKKDLPASLTEPVIELIETGPKSGNLRITVEGNSDLLFAVKACEMGKYAKTKGASFITTPLEFETTTTIQNDKTFTATEDTFTLVFPDDPPAKDWASTENRLKKCAEVNPTSS